MKLPNSSFLATTLTLAGLATSAHAANLIVLLDNGGGAYHLGALNSSTLSATSNVAVSNLSLGDTLIGLDFRAANSALYAVGTSANVYTINATTGIATNIGSFTNPVPGTQFGFDFNPAFMGGNFARVISDLDDNRVISGVDGTYLAPDEKTDVFYAAGDVNAGANPNINHIAYTNSLVGATSTQQYGIDSDLNVLTTVANNAGTLVTIGSLGINASAAGGFDIDGQSGKAFAGFQTAPGISTIYEIDLTTGAATSKGSLFGSIVGLTAVPEPSSSLLAGLAGLGLIARRRR